MIIQKLTRAFLAPTLLLLSCLIVGPGIARAAEEPIPRPPELARDVAFWIRVYSEITTNEGFLHDEKDLGIVYLSLKFRPGVSPTERRLAVDDERKMLVARLKRLASGATDLSDDEQQLKDLFGSTGSPVRFTEAANTVRFQLGQADRFREGLERSGAWEPHIAETFAAAGLPPELAALPHVESSFDPTAYSKVGAAGLWQFMPGTGRRFLRVNDAVDERLDPYRATEAAAQLLDFNYRMLGTWPLALTAYNHGAAGMRRARDAMGTADIATIARNYRSPSFGFASRNFYVSFLAALEIDRNPQKYFPGLSRHAPMKSTEVELPSYVPLSALQGALKVDRARLVTLNPALRPPVWDGKRMVPKGYKLRLPVEAGPWTTAKLADQIGPTDQYVGQPRARSYRVKTGDTIEKVARAQGESAVQIARLNNMAVADSLKGRRSLRLPDIPPARIAAGEAAATAVVASAAPPKDPVPPVVAETRPPPPTRAAPPVVAFKSPEPVTAAQAREETPSLAPGSAGGGAVAKVGDGVEFSVASNGTIRVAADETLGHYADWLNLPASRLRSLNGLSGNAMVSLGRSLKLDFSRVPTEAFEEKRRAFHQGRQSTFFAAHRIVGTEVYVARRGDSLWLVTQRHSAVPAWLLQHYNPDVDFADLRAGVEIVIPKIESVPPA